MQGQQISRPAVPYDEYEVKVWEERARSSANSTTNPVQHQGKREVTTCS